MKEFESEGVFNYTNKTKSRINTQNFERLKVAVSLKQEMGVNVQGIDIILHMREKMARMQTEFNGFLSQVRRNLGKKLDKDLKEKSNTFV